jgi:hypothetical protein
VCRRQPTTNHRSKCSARGLQRKNCLQKQAGRNFRYLDEVLDIVCKKFKIKSGSIEIRLDGQQTLLAASEECPLHILQPDFDLLKDIDAKIKNTTGDQVHWIRGHQDDNVDYQNLDYWVNKNNVQTDKVVKCYWNHCKTIGK